MQRSRKLGKRPITCVAIAPSSISNAGHGLFATKDLSEGTVICTYGKLRTQDEEIDLHSADTIFRDKNGMSVGDHNRDYGCWCNDPRDQSKVNAHIRFDKESKMYVIKLRWDVQADDEIFVDYGLDFWRVHDSWQPTEGGFTVPSFESQPTGIATTDTKPWVTRRTATKDKKRVNRITADYTMDMLKEQSEYDSKIRNMEYMRLKINRVSKQEIEVKRNGKITSEKSRLNNLDSRIRQAKAVQARRAVKRDNPTLEEARKRDDWPMFEAAIKDELYQIAIEEKAHDQKPMLFSQLPKGANVIGSIMILTVKRKPDGSIDKYKARLVALGNHQKESSYDMIKAGTARGSTVKMLVALQAKTQAVSMVLDVKGAYLKSAIKDWNKEKLFLRYPDGRIFKLRKYLFGLKQAGYEWQNNITGTLSKLGYTQSIEDPLVFFKRDGEKWIIMCLHVDDFFVVASDTVQLHKLHEELTDTYGSVSINSGDLLSYLGMQIKTDSNTGDVVLGQPGYARQLCEQFLVGPRSEVLTPMTVNSTSQNDDELPHDITEYLRAVGGINYLAINTRPDLLYALSRLASACSAPTKKDWKRVVRVLLYVSSTVDYGLTFHPGVVELHAYVDSSFNVYHDGKAHYECCYMLGHGDAAFYSVSKRMKVQPLSSTEAEYVAFCECGRDCSYFNRLLVELGFGKNKPIIIYEDNKSCIDMLNGRSRHTASKHINPKFHYGRDLVQSGKVIATYITTAKQIADVFTKPLGKTVFQPLTTSLLSI